eukprot:4216989-Amphidinium_carterae.1
MALGGSGKLERSLASHAPLLQNLGKMSPWLAVNAPISGWSSEKVHRLLDRRIAALSALMDGYRALGEQKPP